MYPSILFFYFGYEKAWAQARAQGFRPRTQGSGSGLENLKPEPAQAEPEPGHPGRAGPATSLNERGRRQKGLKFGAEEPVNLTPAGRERGYKPHLWVASWTISPEIRIHLGHWVEPGWNVGADSRAVWLPLRLVPFLK
ncbi:hypothetical protein B0H16DRAFT_1454140 [Mycena metata]|uniref:Uncharacterized protein n=1 Tax=Mycena metata TaxID=1033252 RepID=A0AAD7JJP4_9AGAR|nr:hypothetical protein B0H16DRAFT_1454140 [Mycena metata]